MLPFVKSFHTLRFSLSTVKILKFITSDSANDQKLRQSPSNVFDLVETVRRPINTKRKLSNST